MRLNVLEAQSLEAGITSLLKSHIKQPFHILRETGVVAELRGLLLQHWEGSQMARPSFKHFPKRDTSCAFGRQSINTEVLRVQMEIQVPLSGQGPCKAGRIANGAFASTKILDLGVLSSEPTLYCAANGAGDVVQQIDLASLTAAIEVKASPSLTPEQRGHYVKDIWALLELAQQGIDSYFVLLDKTSCLYGNGAHARRSGAAFLWASLEQQDILVRCGKEGDFPFESLQDAEIAVHDKRPEAPHVQIWTIERSNDDYVPRQLFATAALPS